MSIGVGGPAGLVLARPLFWQFNKIDYEYILKLWRTHCTHLLQPDHFKSPSYAPDEPMQLSDISIHTVHTIFLHTCIPRAVASYLDVMWPKSCSHKGTAARGVWGQAPPGIAPETIFLPKISVKFLVRGMVCVCGYAPTGIIYLPCSRTCKAVKQLVLSVCQTCARNQTNRLSGVNSKSLWGTYPGVMSDTPQIMHLHNWHSNYSWAQLSDITTPAGCQHFIIINMHGKWLCGDLLCPHAGHS